ncbi:hypothetical protein [Cypionkella sp.]|uniref:hypothetical protein n=1 Tax=Cypionkella sp. TaxID=2811411 RepID=UPI002AB91461|nr:hypothetical protein [Cypionkella sp.]MDZ4393446.1 hypothetical protein [Cypionkella sp.]
MTKYQQPKKTRREAITLVDRFKAGKLAPVRAIPIEGNESGFLSGNVVLELDPIAGNMITQITGEVHVVFAPTEAIDAIKDPNAAYAGMREVVREKLLSGAALFPLETEGELSMRCGINPESVGGIKRVCQNIRFGHNVAVNCLRQRKYVKASLLLYSNSAITPALIGETVLNRLNGVLDPEDRVNGMVQFQTGTITAPVHAGGSLGLTGIFPQDGTATVTLDNVDGTAGGAASSSPLHTKRASGNVAPSPAIGATLPALEANLSGLNIGSISLTDFYNAETQDRITRALRAIVDQNPEHGEEIALRWAHGLSVDGGTTPYVIYEDSQVFGKDIIPAMDSAGVAAETMRSDMKMMLQFSVPVPKTELGGVIYIFASVKPDETLKSQPHPIAAKPWGLRNFVADELALDPVPVKGRELYSDIAQANETTVYLYTGKNALLANYTTYGLSRRLDPATVANKTAVWQLEVPMSVTPESVIYPADLNQYPFADQNAEVVTATTTHVLVLQTPIVFGPTPVEELAIIETADIFEDA